MKYIKILPVWLCVLCLTGCCETENEIGATTETNSEGETEGTALQEAYANESKYEEIIQINEEEENLDESDSIEKIEKNKIPEAFYREPMNRKIFTEKMYFVC